MKTERMQRVWIALFLLAGGYVAAYVMSMTRLQVGYGSPSGSLIAVYQQPWQRALFRPIERLDRSVFPPRWRYDQLKQTSSRLNDNAAQQQGASTVILE